MKSRAHNIPFSFSFQHGLRSLRRECSRTRQQRRWLLGVSILLILCWVVGAIWLINVRRGERGTAEVLAQKGTIAALYAGETVDSR